MSLHFNPHLLPSTLHPLSPFPRFPFLYAWWPDDIKDLVQYTAVACTCEDTGDRVLVVPEEDIVDACECNLVRCLEGLHAILQLVDPGVGTTRRVEDVPAEHLASLVHVAMCMPGILKRRLGPADATAFVKAACKLSSAYHSRA